MDAFVTSIESVLDHEMQLLEILWSNAHLVPNLKQNLFHGQPLLHLCCQKGYQHVVELLLDNNMDAEAPTAGGTPLQIASRCGHLGVVKQLLNNGACLHTIAPWSVNSPFYIATMNGHLNVLEEFINSRPDLVMDSAVRGVLFYAACCSQSLELVKLWFDSDIATRIDRPIELIHTFENCQIMYPMYAACKGNNLEIVNFLIENGASVTEKICQNFPGVLKKVLSNGIMLDNSEQDGTDSKAERKVTLQWSSRNLCIMKVSWFSPYTDLLVEMNVSYNKISILPRCIPWKFPNLKMLNVSHNLLEEILPPEEDGFLPVCNKLQNIDFSHNRISTVCSAMFQLQSIEELILSHNHLVFVTPEDKESSSLPAWDCPNLRYLDLSNNSLPLLPQNLRLCSGLKQLNASSNKLFQFLPPWTCRLNCLKLSHNYIQDIPSSLQNFWNTSMKILELSHNELHEINESIVRLNALLVLKASHNKIKQIPSPELWDCQNLTTLDLGNNLLGKSNLNREPEKMKGRFLTKLGIRHTRDMSSESSIEFPEMLANCLTELYLNDNNLDMVPESLCNLTFLNILDLSSNPGIKELPNALGNLHSCGLLKLDGLDLTNIPKNLMTDEENHTIKILKLLSSRFRQSEPYYGLKLIVMGKDGKGKTSLIDCLLNRTTGGFKDLSGLNITEWKAEIKKKTRIKGLFNRGDGQTTFIMFKVWELAKPKDFSSIHQCFVTPNSLFILVWDLCAKDEVQQLDQWLFNIQAKAPNSSVIIVGSFLDRIPPQDKDSYIKEVQEEIYSKFKSCRKMYPKIEKILEVSSMTGEGIDVLKKCILIVSQKMTDTHDKMQTLLDRKIPRSYLILKDLIGEELKKRNWQNVPPFLCAKELQQLVSKIHDNDITTADEYSNVSRFLHEAGIILFFRNQLETSSFLYFLDPEWLCEMLGKIFTHPDIRGFIRCGKINMKHAGPILQRLYPKDFFPICIELLERFEIAMKIDKNRLLIPSFLPDSSLAINTPNMGQKVFRLYKIPYIPLSLWHHLIIRIMLSLERLADVSLPGFNQLLSVVKNQKKPFSSNSRFHSTKSSMHFFKVKKPRTAYWKEGLFVTHESGSFIIESVSKFLGWGTGNVSQGILITVQSDNDDFSILGIIVDELNDIISELFPGLMDFNDTGYPMVQSFAVCPCCYPTTSDGYFDVGLQMSDIDHFRLEHCAKKLTTKESIICNLGNVVPLKMLVPELLLTEIPKNLMVDKDVLEVKSYIGQGVSGVVFDGKYNNSEVAIKCFQTEFCKLIPKMEDRRLIKSESFGSISLNSLYIETLSLQQEDDQSQQSSASDMNSFESGNMLVLAFSEMRREVALLSRLSHPCIVSLVGFSIQPACIILELAPMGSLHKVLDAHCNSWQFDKYKDHDKIFRPVFSKELTFKILQQVVRGLHYLHNQSILYRDLKSDNILVWTLDLDTPVNVKLSDYSISRYATPHGMVGLAGTPGYQAPEILTGLSYDDKVDIFSWSMLAYEIQSGLKPYHEYTNIGQIYQALLAGKRPSIKKCNIDSKFPYLDHLMEICASGEPEKRPSAHHIFYMMNHTQFLCQQYAFKTPHGGPLGLLDCILSYSPQEHLKNSLIWMWEGNGINRMYHILDTHTGQFRILREACPGARAICMLKLAKTMWVGTEQNEIEIFGCTSTGTPKCQQKISLKATPTAMLRTPETWQEFHTQVYVGMSDATVVIFLRANEWPGLKCQTAALNWREKKCLTLSQQSNPVMCIEFIPPSKELWIACGSSINVVSLETDLLEREIPMYDVKYSRHHIKHLVYDSDKVFYFQEGLPRLIEYDIKSYLPLRLFNFSQRKLVREVSLIENTIRAPQPDSSEKDQGDAAKTVSSQQCSVGNAGDVPPPRHSVCNRDPRKILHIQPEYAGDNPLPQSPCPGSVCAENTSLPVLLSVDTEKADDPHYSVEMRSPLVSHSSPKNCNSQTLRRKVKSTQQVALLSSSHSKDCTTFGSSVGIKPEWHSMDALNISVDIENYDCCITSLLVVKDTLWIGRDSGDIVIVNMRSNNPHGYKLGEVLTVLHTMYCGLPNFIDRPIAVSWLADSSHSVFSTLELEISRNQISATALSSTDADFRTHFTKISSWEKYDCDDIVQIEKYAVMLKEAEGKLHKSIY